MFEIKQSTSKNYTVTGTHATYTVKDEQDNINLVILNKELFSHLKVIIFSEWSELQELSDALTQIITTHKGKLWPWTTLR